MILEFGFTRPWGQGPWGGLSCGSSSGDLGSPKLERELRFWMKLSLLLSKSSQTARGRKGRLGPARAGLGRVGRAFG